MSRVKIRTHRYMRLDVGVLMIAVKYLTIFGQWVEYSLNQMFTQFDVFTKIFRLRFPFFISSIGMAF